MNDLRGCLLIWKTNQIAGKALKEIFKLTQTPSCTFRQSSEVHYIVHSPSQEDEGQYTCIASNSNGTDSSDVYLDVKG